MSLKKRFKILPARIGYKNYSFPHIGALREIIHEQIQKNIFEVYVFRDFPSDTVSLVHGTWV